MSGLRPAPAGIPEAAVEAFFDECGAAEVEAVQAGLSGWNRERYVIARGLAAALHHIGCAALYDGTDGQCPCYQAGLYDAECNCRDPNG
jgi:hypothetical protein